ncbi:MAG: C39 family peptidase [Anaerolineaceae bacterium]|nr:C39 family peptidase [Anaerolineaceae bacterium]
MNINNKYILINKIFFQLICLIALILQSGCSINKSQKDDADPNSTKVVEQSTSQLSKTIKPSKTPSPTLTIQKPEVKTPKPKTRPTDKLEEIALPIQSFIPNISGHKQYFPLGCETSAAIDWAKYYGMQINEFEFQYEIPLSDNPDYGFVGDVNSPWGQTPPYAYGVHAEPIADLLIDYGLNAKAVRNSSLAEIKKNVAEGNPVLVWVIGNCVGGIPHEYTDSHGRVSIVAAYEHVVIVTGYTSQTIRYMNNGKFYDIPNAVFENSWSVLGNMAIFYYDGQ